MTGMALSTGTRSPADWLRIGPAGLCCAPGDFHIDPIGPVERAVITHGHSDHARPGHGAVLATPETIAIMQARYGAEAGATRFQPLAYGERVQLGDVAVTLVPAGHVLGSAQVLLEHGGARVMISGDYKRRADPTCPPFEPVACDVFVTEATFALPVFRHPDDRHEIARLLHSLAIFPDRAHLVGAYALGKCQRVISLLRRAGYDRPIYMHGALLGLCALYERHGVQLGPLIHVTGENKAALKGQIVLAPPSASADRWSRALPDPVVAMASGWMRIKQRAKAAGIELPLVISDHADWDELDRTVDEVGAPEVWITHGREEALVHHLSTKGYRARALALTGFEEEGQ